MVRTHPAQNGPLFWRDPQVFCIFYIFKVVPRVSNWMNCNWHFGLETYKTLFDEYYQYFQSFFFMFLRSQILFLTPPSHERHNILNVSPRSTKLHIFYYYTQPFNRSRTWNKISNKLASQSVHFSKKIIAKIQPLSSNSKIQYFCLYFILYKNGRTLCTSSGNCLTNAVYGTNLICSVNGITLMSGEKKGSY